MIRSRSFFERLNPVMSFALESKMGVHRKIENEEYATKTPGTRDAQRFDIQLNVIYLSSYLSALVAEKTLSGMG